MSQLTKTRYLFLFSTMLLLALFICLAGCSEPNRAGTPSGNTTAKDDSTLSFLFMSDTQADPQSGDYEGFGLFLQQAVTAASEPRLLLLGGDTVNDGGDADEWLKWHQAADTALTGLTVAAAAGNHDNQSLLAEQFNYPLNAPAGQEKGYFYSFDISPVHFIVLDSNSMGAAWQDDIDWLTADLTSSAAQNAAWRIAILHHPLWPVINIPKDEQRAVTMREHFLPLLAEHSVDLILCGHQHIYSRWETAYEGTPLTQAMVASGAKDTYTVTPVAADNLLTVDSTAYLLLQATEELLSFSAYNPAGQEIDTWEKRKEP